MNRLGGGKGRGGEEKRKRGKGEEKERGACRNTSIFRLRSFIIYAGLSFNYSNVRSNNNNKIVNCGLIGNAT